MSAKSRSKKTPLGRLLAEDETLLKALEDIMSQVKVWDALGTEPKLRAQLAKHGIEYREVWKPIKGNPKDRYLTHKLGGKRREAGLIGPKTTRSPNFLTCASRWWI